MASTAAPNGPTAEFIQSFVAPERRDRYLALAAKPSRRRDFTWDLAHDGRHLDRSTMQRLPAADATPGRVAALLKAAGAGRRCFVVVAAWEDFDNTEADTALVLDAVVGRGRDCIVFFPGLALAYYENHEGECYLLRRQQARR